MPKIKDFQFGDEWTLYDSWRESYTEECGEYFRLYSQAVTDIEFVVVKKGESPEDAKCIVPVSVGNTFLALIRPTEDMYVRNAKVEDGINKYAHIRTRDLTNLLEDAAMFVLDPSNITYKRRLTNAMCRMHNDLKGDNDIREDLFKWEE